uniref:Cation-transporting ATPase n=1 Tax=Parastrongyloides trichosuri TaxID=131310 RepID=A0A0N4Z3V8_PARTI
MPSNSEKASLLKIKYPNYSTLSENSMTKVSEINSIAVPFNDSHTGEYVNGETVLKFYGYKKNRTRSIMYWIASVLTIGFLPLVTYWRPQIKAYIALEKCRISSADKILVLEGQKYALKKVRIENSDIPFDVPSGDKVLKVNEIRLFSYRKINFLWHPVSLTYVSVASFSNNFYVHQFHDILNNGDGYTIEKVLTIAKMYGWNNINVKVNPLYILCLKEFLSPFYFFQIFSVAIWFSDQYVIYATIIVFISIVSIITEGWSTKKEEQKLSDMVHVTTTIDVVRNNGSIITIPSTELVPGDIFIVPKNDYVMQCDAVLMSGSCIINEAMLTGESVPETKVPLPEDDDNASPTKYDKNEHSKHTLFCGTTIIQTRFKANRPAKAIVLRTGFTTLKGELVRSIMYPKPVDYSFTKDLLKFVAFLFCVAMLGFTYTIILMALRKAPFGKILVRALDIITVVVPPALPAAMTIGMISATRRLKQSKIHCIAQEVINTCGILNVCAFDKTGTLTEDGLAFSGVRPVFPKDDKHDHPYFGDKTSEYKKGKVPINNRLIRAVATCHSITKVEGQIIGDPVDVLNYEKTGFDFKETFDDDAVTEKSRFDMLQPNTFTGSMDTLNGDKIVNLAVLRTFTFSSALQRMGVIVHDDEDEETKIHFYTKGSPEMISSLCDPDSIPKDFNEVVKSYTKKGYRLIAVAYRDLAHISFTKALKISRDEIECNLKLLGIIIMENKIKPETPPVIEELHKCGIRTLMITGDNILTALSVARECGIIRKDKICFTVDTSLDGVDDNGKPKLVLNQNCVDDTDILPSYSISDILEQKYNPKNLFPTSYQLAISGPTFAIICREYPHLISYIVCICDVFARMTPDQKQFLIHSLIDQNYYVSMCGDGANDCAALKAAHAGISLSTAEASIAAPFTSNIPNISCVPRIICEGRAALVSSFGIFKYMAGYSLCQFTSIMFLYYINTNLTDFQFIFIDLILITFTAIVFGNTPAALTLHRRPPPRRLLSLASILSVLGQLVIGGAFQFAAFMWTSYQSWFIPFTKPIDRGDDEDKRSMQGTAIFVVSSFQYIALAVIYSKGAPYRQSILKNKPLCILIFIQIGIGLFLSLQGLTWLGNLIDMEILPYFSDRLFLVLVSLICVVVMGLYDKYVIEYLILNVRARIMKNKKFDSGTSKNKHERILSKIGNNINWFTEGTSTSKHSVVDITLLTDLDSMSMNKLKE